MNTPKLQNTLKTVFFLVNFSFIFLVFVPLVKAQGVKSWTEREAMTCTGTNAFTNTNAHDVATIQGFGCLIANVLAVTITMIGLLAFVMFIFAAFKLLVKAGDSKAKEQVRGTMTYAVVGIVVALSSFIILNLISQFTGVDVTNFVIPEATTTL